MRQGRRSTRTRSAGYVVGGHGRRAGSGYAAGVAGHRNLRIPRGLVEQVQNASAEAITEYNAPFDAAMEDTQIIHAPLLKEAIMMSEDAEFMSTFSWYPGPPRGVSLSFWDRVRGAVSSNADELKRRRSLRPR
jgi:hypothetical protein